MEGKNTVKSWTLIKEHSTRGQVGSSSVELGAYLIPAVTEWHLLSSSLWATTRLQNSHLGRGATAPHQLALLAGG